MSESLVTLTSDGLYCEAGGFHIDPWNPVANAVITHAHGDHLYRGSSQYLTACDGSQLLKARIGDVNISTLAYGETLRRNGVVLSLHPAGHILGSSQVRIEYRGEVCVVSGDYKLADDTTCRPIEIVRCHTLITESTFGLPIYRWKRSPELFASVDAWWRSNQDQGKTSVLFGHALGKAQRLLAGLDRTIGPIFTHGAVERMTQVYRSSGVALPATQPVNDVVITKGIEKPWIGGLVIAPTSATNPAWLRRFEPYSDAIASGWMQVRGARRRKAVDRGFAISDHADWSSLLTVILESGASHVFATHGFAAVLARHCRELGLEAGVIPTRFGDESADMDAESGDET